MLFLAFFSPCTFTTLPTSKTKADRARCREGAVVEAVVGHGKWVLRGFWLMATVTLEG